MRHLRMTLLTMLLCLLCACSGKENDPLQAPTELRKQLLTKGGCSFHAQIQADMEDRLFLFSLDCSADSDGACLMTLTEPDTIAGIQAAVDGTDAALQFDGTALSFGLRTDGAPVPLLAPSLAVRAWAEGNISSAASSEEGLLAVYELGYAPETVVVNTWLDTDGLPCHVELYYRQKLFCRMDLSNYQFTSGGAYETSEENLG